MIFTNYLSNIYLHIIRLWSLLNFSMYVHLVFYLLLFTTYCFIAYGLGDIFFTYIFINFRKNIPNRLYLISTFILGFYFMGIIYFVSNLSIFKNLINGFIGNYLPIIVISALFTISILHLSKHHLIKYSISKINRTDIMMILIGFIFSLFIVFNYNGVANYGRYFDKRVHLDVFSNTFLVAGGFPIGPLYNIGMQCALLVPTVYLPSNIHNIIYSSLFFGFIMMIAIIYLPYIFSKQILGLNFYFSLLSSIMVVLFGVISLPLTNKYLGFIVVSTSIYHNDTQLFAFPVFIFSIFLLYIYHINNKNTSTNTTIVDNNNYLTLSIIFLSISYFLKPLGYVALAPILILIITLGIISKRRITYRNIIDLFILFLPIITTFVYNLIFKYDSLGIDFAISPLGFLYLYYYNKYYSPINDDSKILTLGSIIVVSLIGFILPLICGLFSKYVGSRNKVFIYLYMVPALIISLLMAFFFIEPGSSLYDFNYDWGVSLISCSMMPFIVLIISKIKNQLLKYSCLTIIFCHLLGGAYHMIYITSTGKY